MTTFERLFLSLSTWIVGLSGVIFAIMKYLMSTDDPFSAVNHPLQPWMLDAHVLAAPALVFALGLIARDHILAQVRRSPRSGRATGLTALWCVLPMVSTGYLIQVVTGETARLICVVVHLATGVVYLAVFAAHVSISRRIAAQRRARAAALLANGGPVTAGAPRARIAARSSIRPAREGVR